MEKVYLESSFISYLVSNPSENLIVAAHQQISFQWWKQCRNHFDCCVSEAVIREISVGDPNEILKRIEIISGLTVLMASEQAEELTTKILNRNILPKKAAADAAHIAIAATNHIDYVITWNCKHLANAQIIKRIKTLFLEYNIELPYICTPEELLGTENV